MKWQKQILILSISCLVVASLVSYVIISLLSGDKGGEQAAKLTAIFNNRIETASGNYTKKKAENDTADIEKEIVAYLNAAHLIFKNIYEGRPTDVGIFNRPGSEEEKEKVKLAWISIEKLIDEIKGGSDKVENQFNEVKAKGKSAISIYLDQSFSKKNRLHVWAWVAVVVTVLFFLAFIAFSYRTFSKYDNSSSQAQLKIQSEAQRVNQLSKFIEAMANGNYDMEIDVSSEDELNSTLTAMRDKLRNNAVEEQRRNWSTTGLAKIGEMLRSTGSASDLYDSIIKFVVKYTNSNQGGLFILEDSNPQHVFLELVSCYAFERKKFLSKQIEIGEGLVGQCFLEQERIHITEVLDDYIQITSGLGGEKPTSCLFMPLKVNDKIYGVIELASFKLYPDHVIELVAKFSESIASTIANVRINESTRILLEQTQQQAEEMKSQEEEMRQNMEELSATQEEMHRKEGEYINRIKELEAQLGVNV